MTLYVLWFFICKHEDQRAVYGGKASHFQTEERGNIITCSEKEKKTRDDDKNPRALLGGKTQNKNR